jgi:acyl dehydratase
LETSTARRRFADLVIGEHRTSSPKTIELADMLDFARRYDPQYFHVDPERARQSIFGEVVASGIYTLAIWRALDHEISGDIAWICGIAWQDVRWPIAVRAGDVLRARAEVLSKRESRSDASRGIVESGYSLINQDGKVVFACRSVNLIEK